MNCCYTAKEMSSSPRPYELQAIAVAPHENLIVGGGGRWKDHPGRIFLWDFSSGELKREDPWSHYELHDILITPDSQTVVASGRDDHTFLDGDHYVYAGNISNGTYSLLLKWRYGSLKLGLSLNEKLIQFDKYFWDFKTGGAILDRNFQALNSNVMPASVEIAEQEQQDRQRGRANKIRLGEETALFATEESFIIESPAQILTFHPGHDDKYFQSMPMAVTHNSQYLIAPRGQHSQERHVTLGKWDIQTGQMVSEVDVCSQGSTIRDIAITSDDKKVVLLAYDPETVIRVIDLTTGARTMEIIPPPI